MHGILLLTDRVTGLERSLDLSMVRRPPIRVVPSSIVLQFDESENRWIGYGMVIRDLPNETRDVHPEKNPAELKRHESPLIQWPAATRAKVTTPQGNRRLNRFKLELTADDVENVFGEERVVSSKLDVRWSGQRVSCACTFIKYSN